MQWSFAQLAEVVLVLAVAVPARLVMSGARRPFLRDLGWPGAAAVRAAVVTADLVTVLVYVSFAVAFLPFETARPVAEQLESAFDTVAVFALLVASVETGSMLSIRRAVLYAEQWPAPSEGARA